MADVKVIDLPDEGVRFELTLLHSDSETVEVYATILGGQPAVLIQPDIVDDTLVVQIHAVDIDSPEELAGILREFAGGLDSPEAREA